MGLKLLNQFLVHFHHRICLFFILELEHKPPANRLIGYLICFYQQQVLSKHTQYTTHSTCLWCVHHIILHNTTTTTILRPFVWDYPGEPVPEETFTHSTSNLYQLVPSTTIHSIFPVQISCLAIFLHDLSSCPLWSTSWSAALQLIFHTFLHPISVFFSQHMPIRLQLFCCSINII